jgi:hypothetical protein
VRINNFTDYLLTYKHLNRCDIADNFFELSDVFKYYALYKKMLCDCEELFFIFYLEYSIDYFPYIALQNVPEYWLGKYQR